jgi:hypothetical protein
MNSEQTPAEASRTTFSLYPYCFAYPRCPHGNPESSATILPLEKQQTTATNLNQYCADVCQQRQRNSQYMNNAGKSLSDSSAAAWVYLIFSSDFLPVRSLLDFQGVRVIEICVNIKLGCHEGQPPVSKGRLHITLSREGRIDRTCSRQSPLASLVILQLSLFREATSKVVYDRDISVPRSLTRCALL